MENAFFAMMISPIPYDWAALLVRLVIGLSLFPYALQKIMNTQNAAHFPKVPGFSPQAGFWLAMFVETMVSICTILGFFTRVVAVAGIINMGVAVKTVHGRYYNATAMPYLLGFIAILCIGAGKYSLDFWLK